MPGGVGERVHILNFNDLEAVEWAFQTYDVACLMSEPILQNIGIVKPQPGYLQSLRDLCDKYGVVRVMDEVKTGFRHAIGGFQSIAGVTPDLSIFGKVRLGMSISWSMRCVIGTTSPNITTWRATNVIVAP